MAPPVGVEMLRRMLDSIQHRGPDDEGIYRSGQVGLGHRRLKIIDLTTGKQPLCNEDGTVWIIYNGEVYNYKELSPYLIQKGHQFKSVAIPKSLSICTKNSEKNAYEQLQGMFSFALWDDNEKTCCSPAIGLASSRCTTVRPPKAFCLPLRSRPF